MKHYRVEHRYPKISKRWAYLPEHDNLTLAKARQIRERLKEFEAGGLRQRIICISQTIVK